MSRDLAGKLAAMLFSIFLMAAIEGGCRLYLYLKSDSGTLSAIHEILQRDPELFWVQRPNLHSEFFGAAVDTDEYGLRNLPGAIQSRDPRHYRIVVAGASPSFGWGVSNDATYARVLERTLGRALPVPAEVINASVIGYSSWQGLRLLRKRMDVLRPDHVVLAYGINDVTRERFFYSGPAEDKDVRIRSSRIANLVFTLASTRVLAGFVDKLRARRADSASYPVRVSLEDFRSNHRELFALARAHGATVSLLIIPFHFPESASEPNEAPREMFASERRSKVYFEALRALARQEQVPLLDTTEPLRRDFLKYFLVDKRDYIHPNAAGHAVIARALAAELPRYFDLKQKRRYPGRSGDARPTGPLH